jgi:hypothetical protein
VKCIKWAALKNSFKLCRIFKSEIYAKVKIGNNLSSEFKVNSGLRPGDAIAALLLDVVLEIAIRRYKVETLGNIFDKCIHIVAYVDDVVILGRRLRDSEILTSLVEQTNKMGLEINGKIHTF